MCRVVKWKSPKVLGEHITRVSPAQSDTENYTTVLTKHKLLVTSYLHIITSMRATLKINKTKSFLSWNIFVVELWSSCCIDPCITFAVIDKCRGVTENSMCGSCGKAISVLGEMWNSTVSFYILQPNDVV